MGWNIANCANPSKLIIDVGIEPCYYFVHSYCVAVDDPADSIIRTPPMLSVRNQEDILDHLLKMADYPAKGEAIGQGAKEWFIKYNGIGLAKQWLELLTEYITVVGKARITHTRLGCLK